MSYIPQTDQHSPFRPMLLCLGNVHVTNMCMFSPNSFRERGVIYAYVIDGWQTHDRDTLLFKLALNLVTGGL